MGPARSSVIMRAIFILGLAAFACGASFSLSILRARSQSLDDLARCQPIEEAQRRISCLKNITSRGISAQGLVMTADDQIEFNPMVGIQRQNLAIAEVNSRKCVRQMLLGLILSARERNRTRLLNYASSTCEGIILGMFAGVQNLSPQEAHSIAVRLAEEELENILAGNISMPGLDIIPP